jgi:alpha-amylase
MPHLRNAIYKHLILAENAIDQILAPGRDYIRCLESDFNADGTEQIRLDNRHAIAWINPAQGGQIYEFDDRRTATNVLATLNRRLEPYHHAVARAAQKPAEDAPEGPSNLHDRITLKHDGLDELLVYDRHPRKALVDHLWPLQTSHGDVVKGVETELAPWPVAGYKLTEVQESEENVAVLLAHEFSWDDRLLKLEKTIRLNKTKSALDVTYKIQGLADRPASKFAIEINMAAMAGYEHDRQFRDHHGNDLGTLSTPLQLQDPKSLTAVDGWLNLANRVEWQENRPAEVWTMPIQTVSNSEGGYEKVFQSAAVLAIWTLGGEADEFSARFRWSLGTAREMA